MIRAMTPEDLPEIFRVRTATVENTISLQELKRYGITEPSLTKALESTLKGWVHEHLGRISGFVMGDQATGEIQVLVVLPDYEKQGIGSTLLLQVQEWLFSTGLTKIWLKTTPDSTFRAYGFYQKFGWVPSGKLDGDDEIFILENNNLKSATRHDDRSSGTD